MNIRHASTGDDCLDAETIAAWVDGGLPANSRAVAEAHISNCARCRAIVATMARMEPVVAGAPTGAPRRRWLGWLLPAAAAAAVVIAGVLMVPDTPGTPGAPGRPESLGTPGTRSTPPVDLGASEKAAGKPRSEFAAKVEPPVTQAPPPAALSGQTAAQSAQARTQAEGRLAADASAKLIIESPDALIRWRVDDGRVSRSTDGGATWVATPTGIAAEITAGASPAPTVVWLAGRAGVVLLTTDGRTWRRLAFPEATDLSAIRATDGRIATVTTADGRVFATTDAGATWFRR